MQLVGYGRVSTDEQKKEGVSVPAQRAGLAALAESRKFVLVDTCIDEGISAKAESIKKRPQLLRALELIDSGKAEGMAVMKLDRLSRSVRDWDWMIVNYFGPKRRKPIVSASETIDLLTASGRMLSYILMAVAQGERENTAERTKRIHEFKAARFENTGTVPYGWQIDPAADGPRSRKKGNLINLVPNPFEQVVLGNMSVWHAEGMGARAMARELNFRNVPTRRGGPWRPSTVAEILQRLRTEKKLNDAPIPDLNP